MEYPPPRLSLPPVFNTLGLLNDPPPLRRALQEAGAESVLMSLWAVQDRETRELMTLFYDKWLSGMDKHAALRAAPVGNAPQG